LHEYYTVTVMRSRSNEYGEIRIYPVVTPL
jgi:hypothetical protein